VRSEERVRLDRFDTVAVLGISSETFERINDLKMRGLVSNETASNKDR